MAGLQALVERADAAVAAGRTDEQAAVAEELLDALYDLEAEG